MITRIAVFTSNADVIKHLAPNHVMNGLNERYVSYNTSYIKRVGIKGYIIIIVWD